MSEPSNLHRTLCAAALMLGLFLLGGCAGPEDNVHLNDSRWRFALIDGHTPLSDAADVRFADGEITVLVGCNRMTGPWRVNEDRLVAGPLDQTEMACPAPAWDQEKAVSALFAATPRLEVSEDKLLLQSGGHSAELIRAAAL
ncbi:META domain-containing protein [Novosphingobium sp. YJ-S2-02]|uniref:META domain-containing protein n=1 Tax=Novosphingobium aureum TaxID=2792964 RepID=A0A931HDT7_9SPHN|nr:META domain-containing protein [Novosphingobium aureum]MBH0113598.1 META domain-containing protein [Novosphingobium aureum]